MFCLRRSAGGGDMHQEQCLFCKIVRGLIPARKVYENEWVTVFADIAPQAPVHFLIVPTKHFDNLLALKKEDGNYWDAMLEASQVMAKQEKLTQGFRLVINNGEHAGQAVGHLHLHLLAGRSLAWPPG